MDNGLVYVSVLPPIYISSGTVMLCYVLCPLLYISHWHGHTGPRFSVVLGSQYSKRLPNKSSSSFDD